MLKYEDLSYIIDKDVTNVIKLFDQYLLILGNIVLLFIGNNVRVGSDQLTVYTVIQFLNSLYPTPQSWC